MQTITKTEPMSMSEVDDNNLVYYYTKEILNKFYKGSDEILERMKKDERFKDGSEILEIILSSAASFFGSTLCNLAIKSMPVTQHKIFVNEVLESVKIDVMKVIKKNINENN